jgi:cytochrome c-type biogenesis protein CcmH/NrfF
MTTLLWITLALLVVVAGVRVWLRARRGHGPRVHPLTDEEIRRLERGGSVSIEPPTDMGEVAEEEQRFWEEHWDEPDEPFG